MGGVLIVRRSVNLILPGCLGFYRVGLWSENNPDIRGVILLTPNRRPEGAGSARRAGDGYPAGRPLLAGLVRGPALPGDARHRRPPGLPALAGDPYGPDPDREAEAGKCPGLQPGKRRFHDGSDVDITVDKSLNGIRREAFDQYLVYKTFEKNPADDLSAIRIEIEHKDSKTEPGIQAADFIAGALHYYYRTGDDVYSGIIDTKVKIAFDYFNGPQK